MEFEERKLIGVMEITPNPHLDERGFFMRTYDENIFQSNFSRHQWVQENHSRSEKKGIIRGLHFQHPPHSETKLIRCIRGAVLDVFVDLRFESETFGMWDSIYLSEDNKKMVLIPRGFAHGFCTLTDISEVVYKVDNYYSPDHEEGIIWNDQSLKIDWGVTNPTLSSKDQMNLTLKEFVKKYQSLKV